MKNKSFVKMFIFLVAILFGLLAYMQPVSVSAEDALLESITNYGSIIDASDDKIIDTEYFSSFLSITDRYIIFPLYNMSGDVTALVTQYYDKEIPVSYLVTSNKVNPQDAYYIEYGTGNFLRFLGDKRINELCDGSKTIMYFGGNNYFIYCDDVLYVFQNNEYTIIPTNLDFIHESSGGNYYAFGETLNLTAVYAKEVGYSSQSGNYYTGSISNLKTMDETKAAYYAINSVNISEHCGATAALNLMLKLSYCSSGDWQNTFCSFYNSTGSNATITNVSSTINSYLYSKGYLYIGSSISYYSSWSSTTSLIDYNPIILLLQGSEIYGNHYVIGLGYRWFTHSSGWGSKYYEIFDGFGSEIRYVHSQLGINCIHVISVNNIVMP